MKLPGRKPAAQPAAKPAARSAAKATAKGPAKPSRRERMSQIRETLSATAKTDPKFMPILIGVFFGVLALFLLIGFLIDQPIILGILGVAFAAIAAMAIAGRRASGTAFARIEGQPGAAYAVLGSMRGDWRVTQAVEFTRNFELVHRVIGRPGVILVAEGGSAAKTRELVGTHARKVRRVIGDKPIYDVIVGDAEGQVPLRKLQTHLMKLPRNLTPKEVNELEGRLRAVGGPNMPIPKGPMPRQGKIR